MLRLLAFGLLIFFTLSFLIRTDGSFNQDLGRHIKLGGIIAQESVRTNLFDAVPKVNLFSQDHANFPFVNHHWLFELSLYWSVKVFGIGAVLALKVVVFLIATGIILLLVWNKGYIWALPIGFIVFHVLRERTQLRPEIFSFLFTALTLWILERRSKRLLFVIPLIQLLWVNIHIYFPLGLMLIAIYLIDFSYKKDWSRFKFLAFVALVSILVTLINPNGLKGALYPLAIFSNYGYPIAENQTMFFLENLNFANNNFIFVKVSIVIFLVSVILAIVRHRYDVKSICLVALGIILALMNIRSFPYLVFLSFPAAVWLIGEVKLAWWHFYVFVLAAMLILFESYFYLNGDYYRYTDSGLRPKLEISDNAGPALDFVVKNSLPGLIFNNFDIGSNIIYRGYPKYRVFVDGRPEAYPADFFQKEYIPMQEDYKLFSKKAEEYRFKTIIFSHTDQTPWASNFMQFLIKDNNWSLVYLDDFMTVFTGSDYAQEVNIPKLNLAELEVERYSFSSHVSYLRISIFLLNGGYSNSAEKFVRKSLDLFPDSPLGNRLMAHILLDKQDLLSKALAEEYIDKSRNEIFW